jgi:cell division protein FtsW
MTEMVHGAGPAAVGEPILPRWWRTIDRWSLGCVLLLFGIGLLLGLAASPPLAERNGLPPVPLRRAAGVFGLLALVVMVATSMMAPVWCGGSRARLRRRSCRACFLPVFGTDFGKGAVRWYSLGFGSVQPSEFLKPCFVVVTAWFMVASGAGTQRAAGRSIPRSSRSSSRPAGDPADFGQAALILFGWGVMYFVAGAPILLLVGVGAGRRWRGVARLQQLGAFRAADRRVPLARDRPDDPDRLCHERDPRGRFLRRRRGRGAGEVVAARRAYRLHHRRGGRGIRAVLVLVIIALYATIVTRSLHPADARARPVHPARRARGSPAPSASRR